MGFEPRAISARVTKQIVTIFSKTCDNIKYFLHKITFLTLLYFSFEDLMQKLIRTSERNLTVRLSGFRMTSLFSKQRSTPSHMLRFAHHIPIRLTNIACETARCIYNEGGFLEPRRTYVYKSMKIVHNVFVFRQLV